MINITSYKHCWSWLYRLYSSVQQHYMNVAESLRQIVKLWPVPPVRPTLTSDPAYRTAHDRPHIQFSAGVR